MFLCPNQQTWRLMVRGWLIPGAAPFFMSERAMQKLKSRKTKVASYYFDMNLVGAYWGWYGGRFYHCTGMISNW